MVRYASAHVAAGNPDQCMSNLAAGALTSREAGADAVIFFVSFL